MGPTRPGPDADGTTSSSPPPAGAVTSSSSSNLSSSPSSPSPLQPSSSPSLFASLNINTLPKTLTTLVSTHHTSLSYLSTLISNSTYLLPTRFLDDSYAIEVTCALSDLVSFVNDSVKFGLGGGDGCTISGADSQLQTVKACRAVVAVVECVEVAVEKVATARGMDAQRLVRFLEGCKMFAR